MNYLLNSHGTLLKLLHNGISQMNQSYSCTTKFQLLSHFKLMWRNKKLFKLSKYSDFVTLISKNILESLSIAPYIEKRSTILDAGMSMGLPGIPLAITMPKSRFILLDNNVKKIKFLQQACYHLHLNNIQIVHKNIDDYNPDRHQTINAAIYRHDVGFSHFLSKVQSLLTPGAQVLISKKVFSKNEIEKIKKPFHLVNVHTLKVPYINDERYLLDIRYNPIPKVAAG